MDKISDRCLRCYSEQEWYGKNFLHSFLEEKDLYGKKILEVGCAEAGLLKYFTNKGANCHGIELSDIRFGNALELNKNNSINIFQANICNSESYKNEIPIKFDIIILRDVIEHIPNKELALKNIFKLLKKKGKLFMSYPPKYCAYAGHQQTIPNILGKLPYLHIFPNFLYVNYLKLINCPQKKIEYLIETKKTRVSIKEMKRILSKTGFNIIKESNWLLRPAYSYRFNLPKIKNPFHWVPLINEILCNGILFLIERPNK